MESLPIGSGPFQLTHIHCGSSKKMTDQMQNSAQSDTVLQLTARVRELEAALRAAGTKDDTTSFAATETEALPSATFSNSVKMEAPLLDGPPEPEPSTVPHGNSIPTPSVSSLHGQSQAVHTIPTPSVSMPFRQNVALPNTHGMTPTNNTTTSISMIKREQNSIELLPNQPPFASARAAPAPLQPAPHAATSQDPSAPNYQELMYPTGASKQCSCKKSRCLKLYCECFAANVFCKDCKCNDCHNVPEHAEVRMRAIQYKLQRRPGAFKPKFTPKVDEVKQAEEMRHSRGCNCKKSGCNKRYCECYQNGVACSAACKCTQCKNSAVAPLPSTIPRRAPDSVKKGFLSWRIPLSAEVVNAMGTKSKRNRKVFPADFVPGQEPSFTFTPYGGTAPSLHPAPSSTSSDAATSRKRRREAVVEQSSVKRRSTRLKRPTRHCAGSQESVASAAVEDPISTDASDSFYSCSNSEDAESELEIEFMDTDPELAAALFDAVDAGQIKSTPGDQLGDSGLWLTEDFHAVPNVSFQSLSDSVPDLNRALQDAREEMQSTENTIGEAKPVIDDFCMDDIQLAKPDIQLATEPSTDTRANSSSTLCGSIDEEWIVSDSMLDDVACPATSKLDDNCADSLLRHDSTDSFFSGLAA